MMLQISLATAITLVMYTVGVCAARSYSNNNNNNNNNNDNFPDEDWSEADNSSTTKVVNINTYKVIHQDEYEPASTTYYVSDSQSSRNYANTTTLLDIKFASNFSAFNPRNPSSSFQFLSTYPPFGITQDSAAFLSGDDGLINMVSVPFNHWLPQFTGVAAVLQSYDTSVELKNAINVTAGQVLAVSLQFRCRTINTRLHRFPKIAVTKAEDDPRLSNCALFLVDTQQTGLGFGVLLTNKGVWLKYGRDAIVRVLANTRFDSFDFYRRVRSRSVYEVINARIEIDRSVDETRFYINDKLVWTVGNWGVLSNSLLSDRRNKLIAYSPSGNGTRQQSVVPAGIRIFVNNAKKLDESDPNRNVMYTGTPNDNSTTNFTLDYVQYISPALVRLTNLSNYYGDDVDFYDQNSPRNSSLWGQGAISGLYSLLAQLHSGGVSQSGSTNDGEDMAGYGSESGQEQDAINSDVSSSAQENEAGSHSDSQQQNNNDNNDESYQEHMEQPKSRKSAIKVVAEQQQHKPSQRKLHERRNSHQSYAAPIIAPSVGRNQNAAGSVGSIADVKSGYVNRLN